MNSQTLAICITAFLASGLTLFSGFGLGTLLMPVMALFYPLPVAVAMTAIVHLLNNLFKLSLTAHHAKPGLVLRFGIPAVLTAWAGAQLLDKLSSLAPLLTYHFFHLPASITGIKLLMGGLIIGFSILEISPQFKNLSFDPRFIPWGGALSGFFGGLSGHQGVLRSAFLVKAGLSKESFIGTGVVIACFVDMTRLFVYSKHPSAHSFSSAQITSLVAATLAAFVGAWLANRFLHKMTLRVVQNIVAGGMILIGAGLMAGVL